MERVLDIYKRPYDEKFPVVCYDEMPRQLLEEVREIQPMRPGRSQRVDYEYRRMGTCNVLLASEPLRGWRMADVTQTKTAKDWAMFTEKIASAYPTTAITSAKSSAKPSQPLPALSGRNTAALPVKDRKGSPGTSLISIS